MYNSLAYLFLNKLEVDDEVTFTTDLANPNSKDVVDFITLLKNKILCDESKSKNSDRTRHQTITTLLNKI